MVRLYEKSRAEECEKESG